MRESAVRAVRAGGGEPVPVDAAADALVWLDPADLTGLSQALAATPAARWVQLPFAGIEQVAGAGLLDPARTWTCAKGAYAEPVAEHALMLALAGLRLLRQPDHRPVVGRGGGREPVRPAGDHPRRRRHRGQPARACWRRCARG